MQCLDAEIAHDVDRAVACGGSSTTALVRRAEIVSGEFRDFLVARALFYEDVALKITTELKEVFQRAFT